MKNFEGFGLSPALAKSLAQMNYQTPTPVQAKAIPLALQGRDVLGSAQTGTGKTAAFSIPMVEKIMRAPRGTALVLTPTRELAKQVLDVIHQLLGPKTSINTAFIIGGDSMAKQLKQLQAKPRIIVGTPGRINDHLARGSMMLNDTDFLVLDEVDRMLDMGFGVQLDKILKFLPKNRQTLMFSATLPKEIIQLSGKYLTNPERISIGQSNVIAVNIKQDIVRIDQDKKYEELLSQLHDRQGSVIIFAKTKYGADRMAKNLRRDGFTSEALHGDLRQNRRDKVMMNFRNKNFRVLVATDIAARGLDVPHIEHVINYDLPQVAEDYIHRMGRTARAGSTGSALCFISPQDGRKWHAIEQLLNPGAPSSNQDRKKSKGKEKPRGNRRSNNFKSGKPSVAGKSFKSERSSESNKSFKSGKPSKSRKGFRPANNSESDRGFESGKSSESDKGFKSGKPSKSGKTFGSGKSFKSDKSSESGKGFGKKFKSEKGSESDKGSKSGKSFKSGKTFGAGKGSESGKSFASGKPSGSGKNFKSGKSFKSGKPSKSGKANFKNRAPQKSGSYQHAAA